MKTSSEYTVLDYEVTIRIRLKLFPKKFEVVFAEVRLNTSTWLEQIAKQATSYHKFKNDLMLLAVTQGIAHCIGKRIINPLLGCAQEAYDEVKQLLTAKIIEDNGSKQQREAQGIPPSSTRTRTN